MSLPPPLPPRERSKTVKTTQPNRTYSNEPSTAPSTDPSTAFHRPFHHLLVGGKSVEQLFSPPTPAKPCGIEITSRSAYPSTAPSTDPSTAFHRMCCTPPIPPMADSRRRGRPWGPPGGIPPAKNEKGRPCQRSTTRLPGSASGKTGPCTATRFIPRPGAPVSCDGTTTPSRSTCAIRPQSARTRRQARGL
jgi:hypothetical protein